MQSIEAALAGRYGACRPRFGTILTAPASLPPQPQAFYSTPSIYTDAKLESGKSYTLKGEDFMPYADGKHNYWSGCAYCT